ncbi:dihydroorotate dehydrogenase [Venenivibrio stagnispumantis]|uniref:Dihydroorotate dehydrogenase n=1 Tax=Venenivibrio stagnispumantis TaxID=407998 RepID=A0AA45WIC8_9AQUI|nr:dihydroorotate dehydrogenase [Venenivibrio stagnispumantis]MCW4572778.1 dihydroorotate dehydrogenase [Venenivibrio stagnispumantis]SMP00340.1 dihydroorotate dehydrogenase (NAD+) catalytic subunit [Venenivibrio stagnispumantis]
MEDILSYELFGVKFKNPVWTASGTFSYGLEVAELYDLSELGAIVVKGLSLKPRKGNPPERIVETPAGMLNSIGLQNPGVDYFIENILPKLKKYDTRIFANVFGEDEEEYMAVTEKLDKADGVDGLELNVSCPNVKKGGLAFGNDPETLYNLVYKLRKLTKKPLIVKLSPNITNILDTADACVSAKADGLVLINTLLGVAIDVEKEKPILSTITGGLSGPAILPIAVRMIWQVYSKYGDKVPIIGVGGITTYQDALQHILAGAIAIQVGTANFYDPFSPLKIKEGLIKHINKKGYKHFLDLVGKAHKMIIKEIVGEGR